MYLNNPMDLSQARVREQSFITRVYGWMCFALAVTAFAAWYTVTDVTMLKIILTNKVVFWGIIIATLAIVMSMTAMINRISYFTALCMYIAYSVLNGLMLSTIFIVYTKSSIASTFFATSATFALMSCWGWYSKKDLTTIGSFCSMALIGVIIASIVNIFMQNSAMYWIITYAGILVFVGLTAYDTQKIKNMSGSFEANSEEAKKGALIGALALYLDFINLFLMLLRIFGDRK